MVGGLAGLPGGGDHVATDSSIWIPMTQ
jgi:hypothetical protein